MKRTLTFIIITGSLTFSPLTSSSNVGRCNAINNQHIGIINHCGECNPGYGFPGRWVAGICVPC